MTKQEHDALVDEMLTLMTPTADSQAVARLCEIRNLLVSEEITWHTPKIQGGISCS